MDTKLGEKAESKDTFGISMNRSRIAGILFAAVAVVVAFQACPQAPTSAPSSTTVTVRRARTNRQNRVTESPLLNLRDTNPLTSSLLPLSGIPTVSTPTFLTIEDQRQLLNTLLADAHREVDDYSNRGEMAATDLEVLMDTSETGLDHAEIHRRMVGILTDDYGVAVPHGSASRLIELQWGLSTRRIEGRFDETAWDLKETGRMEEALRVARAAGSVGVALDIAHEQGHDELLAPIVLERLGDVRSEEEWGLFFNSALRDTPELLISIYPRLSAQQKTCAIRSLQFLIQFTNDEIARCRGYITETTDPIAIDYYNATIANNESSIRRYQLVLALYQP